MLNRVVANTLNQEDFDLIRELFDTLEFIIDKLNQKNSQLKAILRGIFGIKSEKSTKIQEKLTPENQLEDSQSSLRNKTSEEDLNTAIPDESIISQESASQKPEKIPSEKKKKGHGRNGVKCYTGAKHTFINHSSLAHGDKCPECLDGKVYRQKKPGVFIYIEGQTPIQAKVCRLEKFRCNLCGKIFQADLPEEISSFSGSKHYDETAKSMMAVLRYQLGVPLYRLEGLQRNLGIPLAASTQWDKIEELANKIHCVFQELKYQAAQGDLIHNDDTGMKILSVIKEIDEELKTTNGKIRKGIFTTGIISIIGNQKIALYFTGRKHAGENFAELLENRESDRSPPIQMCDAKNGNTPKDANVIESNCNTHARRNFVNVAEDFPDECLYVIVDVFYKIYKYDAMAKDQQLSPDERLKFHQDKSGPIMNTFHAWLNQQFDNKHVEPNSSLGKAITYVLNHWEKLTRFLHVPGVPLDNNICERALKKAILHRKNSMFYKTEHGAYVGDLFMSLIHTCNLANENAFDYLTQLQINSSQVFKNPDQWLPWNYRITMAMFAENKSVA